MTGPPWRTDCPLDAGTVRGILCAQFPELSAPSVEPLAEGWTSRAYTVDGTWVFRFPKRQEVDVWLGYELPVLRHLANLPLGLAIPRPAFEGRPGPLFPYRFMGYRRIPGTPADEVDPARLDRAACARQLGRFLSVLHGVGEAEGRAAGMRAHEDTLATPLAEIATLRDDILARLPAPFLDRCRPYLEGTAPPPAEPRDGRCLVHADLTAEHLLVGEDGRLAGIIDWGDAGLADPSSDFAGLQAGLGPEFVEQVLAHYTAPRDPGFRDRLAWRARCLALITLGWEARQELAGRPARPASLDTAFPG